MPDHCSCGNPIARPRHRRKTDLCRTCAVRAFCSSDEHRAKLAAGQKRRWAAGEVRRTHAELISNGIRRALENPEALAAAKVRGQACGRSNRGRKLDPDLVARRAASISDARLGWCPRDLRPRYRKVRDRIGAAAAKLQILGEIYGHRELAWCPDKYQGRFLALLAENEPVQARRLLTEEIIDAGDALELQLHRLRRGATLEESGPIVRAPFDRTYGGVAAYG